MNTTAKLRLIKTIPLALATGGVVYAAGRIICRKSGISITGRVDRLTPENTERSVILATSAILAATGTALAGFINRDK